MTGNATITEQMLTSGTVTRHIRITCENPDEMAPYEYRYVQILFKNQWFSAEKND